jgi:hypothetical protein
VERNGNGITELNRLERAKRTWTDVATICLVFVLETCYIRISIIIDTVVLVTETVCFVLESRDYLLCVRHRLDTQTSVCRFSLRLLRS